MKKQNIGVIILTFNSARFIEKCLKSLLKNNILHKNCVVVDNASTDKTVNIVQNKYPGVKVLKSKRNIGYAAGNNLGIKYFMQKKNISYLLILNPDTLVEPNLLTSLATVLDKNIKVGAVAPIITYTHENNIIWYAGGYLNKLFCFTKHPFMNTNIKQTKIHSGITNFTTGACMLIRKSVLKKHGLLPTDYFMYFEDVDFCQRIKRHGYSSYLLALPLVRHAVSASAGEIGTNKINSFRAYYYARNPFIYIKKNVNGIYRYTNFIGQFFISLPYYGLMIILSGDLKALPAYFNGLKDGIKYTSKQA